MSVIEAKICGIGTPEVLEPAAKHGARWAGFAFYPPSRRSVEPDVGAQLVRQVPTGLLSVGLFVDPTDEELDSVLDRVPLDLIQLHGAETPQRVPTIRARWATPAMKATSTFATLGASDRTTSKQNTIQPFCSSRSPTARLPAPNHECSSVCRLGHVIPLVDRPSNASKLVG